MDVIPLSQVLIQLRTDLLAAQQEGQGQELRFIVDDAEVELQVVATKEAQAGGGVRIWVLNAEGQGKAGETATQKLRLKLKTVDAKGNPVYISGRDRR